jgi:anthranilate phosphoribosyltransferase
MELAATIVRLVDRQNLDEGDAEQLMLSLLDGESTPAQTASLLTALRMKGETVAEITGFAKAMRARALTVHTRRKDLVDICGTGGGYAQTFNISTLAALVAAGAGCTVAKHVFHAVSSECGSADLLEELGVRLDLDPEQMGKCIDEVGIGFLYAPRLHPALRYVQDPRRDIRIRTAFDLLIPLANPTAATARVLGVYAAALTEPLASVLRALGSRSAFVVHGGDGMDEFSITGVNKVSQLEEGMIHTFALDSLEFDLPRASLRDVRGGSRSENAAIARRVLGGERGPARDIVVLNAAAALFVAGAAEDLREGVAIANQALDDGAARDKLQELTTYSRALDPVGADRV